jgi:hypothetical protein
LAFDRYVRIGTEIGFVEAQNSVAACSVAACLAAAYSDVGFVSYIDLVGFAVDIAVDLPAFDSFGMCLDLEFA